MRAHHFLGIAAVIVLGFVLQQLLFGSPIAEAEMPAPQMDVMQMHREHPAMEGMKVDRIHDRSTVFTDQE
jgi:hypothetical protein